MAKERKGFLMVLTTAVLWGMIGLFSRQLSAEGFTSIQITLIRSVLNALILLGILCLTGRSRLRIRLQDIPIFIGSGVIGNALFNICYFRTIEEAGLASAAVLLYTAPCFVMLLSAVLFREKITGVKFLALLLSFTGCVLVSGFRPGESSISGAAFLTGLGSGFFYALYSIFLRIGTGRGVDSDACAFYTYLFSALALIPFANIGEMAVLYQSTPAAVLWSILIAVVSTFLPSVLYTRALTMIETGKASMIAYAEPLTAALIGVFVFGERLDLLAGIGIILILAALMLLGRKS